MNACLKNSNLWAYVKILKLTTNMRVRLQNDDCGQTFSDQLLAIGNRTQKYRRPRNQQYCFDQDSRPGSPLQVSRHSFGTK